MNAYINKFTKFDKLYSESKCEITFITNENDVVVNRSMLSKGDLLFDSEGSCGIIKSIDNNLCTVLVVNKVNNVSPINNATINRV